MGRDCNLSPGTRRGRGLAVAATGAFEKARSPADPSPSPALVQDAATADPGEAEAENLPRYAQGASRPGGPNRLAHEKSSYLHSAAHQPVDWHPWGEEAFEKARKEDRPILLDIGVVWCHWCHVMDRESYENPEIARLINRYFVAIKVDRDERPDIDLKDDGDYWTWTKQEIEAVLPGPERKAFVLAYDIREKPGHLPDEARAGRRVLFLSRPPDPQAPGVLGRPHKDLLDSPVPPANAVAALALDRLSYLTNDLRYARWVEETLRSMAGSLRGRGTFAATTALAIAFHLDPPAHAVIIGRRSDPRTQALVRTALSAYRPGKVVSTYAPDRFDSQSLPAAVAALLASADPKSWAGPKAYVCSGSACALPTGDPKQVVALLRSFGR